MTPSAQEIEDWIAARVGALTGAAREEIDVRAPLTRHGLDSIAVVALASDLEKWLGYRFRANPLEDHPTIEALSRFLAQEVAKRGGPG